MKKRNLSFIVLAFLVLAIGGVLFFADIKIDFSKYSKAFTLWSENEGGDVKEGDQANVAEISKVVTQNTFVELAKKLNPAVVNIYTTKVIKRRGFRMFPSPYGEEDPFGDFFERFFGDQPPQTFKQQSLGSGFIINKEGYIITNNHVVENADEIKVRLTDEKDYTAKIIGKDPKIDIALVKIDAGDKLPIVALGDSSKLEIGEWVMAIGNPFGLSHTVTAGIVSAKGRVIGAGPYDDFIQTDASINPGNSGGPLFNIKGEVVGINTAIIASGQGIGFAIPINLAKDILPQLKEKGKVVRGWLGVTIQKVTPELAESFNMKEPKGALVSSIIKGSPAEKTDIKVGDIIVEFDGQEIDEMHDLPTLVAKTPVGKNTEVKVFREGKIKSIKVTVGELTDEAIEAELKAEESGVSEKLGIQVQNITPQIARNYNISNTEGVIVSSIESGSVADNANIQRGDIIREIFVKGKVYKIKDTDTYLKAINKVEKGDLLRLLIERGNATIYITLRME